MTFNLQMPSSNDKLKPTITVFGVGGAGGNAVNNMINANLEGASFVMANTDAQALDSALTDRVIQLGANITQGLGAGSHPDVGRASAEEAAEEIMSHINGSNMVFITAGMGGGTGTGAAPIIARMAREQGILTVAVVTKPFHFEGTHRMKLAEAGLEELQKYVDTMIVIPNQNLFRVANEKTTFADAFRMADEVLHSGVRGVTDLMVMPGLINLDFSDIRTVMREMGKAMMGTGEADGERRAVEAAEAAISNPLLDDVSMKGARGVLINITGGYDMTLFEVDEAANRIRDEVDPDANIIFGSTFNESMEGKMRVSVVATGIDQAAQFQKPISHDNSSDNPRNYSTRISGGSQTKDDGSSARNNLTFGKPETSTEAKKESAAPLAASMATRPVEPRPEARASAPAQPVRQSQGLRQLRPSLQPQENEASRPAQQEITDQMAADILEESRADLQGALFDETAEEVIAASAGGPRGSIRTAPSPAQRSAAPSGMQQLRNDHPQNPAEEDHEHHSGFFSRVTSRFAPAAEEQQPRRVEVKTSRTVVPDDEDYLEIPAFLRRQAN